jgi:uncharacterized protein YjbI with pentapeptide repeats
LKGAILMGAILMGAILMGAVLMGAILIEGCPRCVVPRFRLRRTIHVIVPVVLCEGRLSAARLRQCRASLGLSERQLNPETCCRAIRVRAAMFTLASAR